ncbi:MAG: LptF/LptG family permease [Candidatus Cloacimonadia bacterium]
MKIISKYILKEHLGPFLISIGVITGVMLLDQILDLLDTIITKHLSLFTVVELFGLSLPFMLALSIPMAVLVGTIMGFGRLASQNEITAFRASGVSTFRLLVPPLVAAILLSFFMIYFNNYILPESNYALKNLLLQVRSRRPTSELKPGLFTKLEDYNFYFYHKNEETGLFEQVIIYDRKGGNFPRMITAKNGDIQLSNGGNSLSATLYNGEIHELDNANPHDYTIMHFNRYHLDIPDLGFAKQRELIAQRGDREMSGKAMQEKVTQLEKTRSAKLNELRSYERELELLPTKFNDVNKIKEEERKLNQLIKMRESSIKNLNSEINRYQVEIHKKYSIAFACIVFVLIGAPIGMMTRTHTIGRGFAVSALVFLVYYISLYGGEELADRLIISPFWAMWISNIIFMGVGIYLVIYTVKEQHIIHLEKFQRLFGKKQHTMDNDTKII